MAHLAIHPDATFHLPDELHTGRKAETAILSSGRHIDLCEALKDDLLHFWRNSDSRIRDGKVQLEFFARILGGIDAHGYPSRFGEFDGIADQVQQDLTQPDGVAHHPSSDARANFG